MGYQVNLKEARPVLLPVGKGPNGDGALKQTPRLGGGEGAASSNLVLGLQQSVNGRRAHPTELGLDLSRNSPLTMSP